VIFVDTNVYFYAHDEREPAKRAACRDWLRALGQRRLGRSNLQVANEFVDVVLRKRRDIDPETVFRLADDIQAWGAAAISDETVQAARYVRRRTAYSWWDCLLLASALELGCTHFLSEDLQDGQRIDMGGRALTIVDPFAHSPEQFLASR
jgi:predicted nucleic acid-binding protein